MGRIRDKYLWQDIFFGVAICLHDIILTGHRGSGIFTGKPRNVGALLFFGGQHMNIGRETEFIEFKKSTSEAKEGIISISSILNKHNNGTVYFGVKDNGDVAGQDIGKDTVRKLSRDISENIKPHIIWYEVEMKQTDDGKSFIEVSFSGSDSPYSAYGRYYQRFADEDRQISDTELERIFRSRQKDYSEWENADSSESTADIDEALLKKVIADGNECGRIRYGYTDAAAILSKLGLYNIKTGVLTNAGRMLFSAGSPVLLKTAVYATETKETFIRLNHFEGNIFECIDEGISFILSAINWDVTIDKNPRRSEKPEIPQTAIREMVINAFAHGCYYANTSFAVEVFSDRVTIYSPGNFPAGYTPEDFASSAAEPIMLNPKIVNVLFKAAVIESFGTEYERTFAACRNAGVAYSYENTKTGFRFTLSRSTGKKAGRNMTKSEQAVYGYLRESDCLTATELAQKIGKTEKTVYRSIKKLKGDGYIRRAGSDSDGYWEILK